MTNEDSTVIIAGAGIGGLTTALTLHQIGVPCRIYETFDHPKPLGVGINLQPNAVRELYALGITSAHLDAIGVPCREWALVGLGGNDIYAEARGLEAGYNWPQYAVHRGELQMLLYRTVLERLGGDAIVTGHTVTGYRQTDSKASIFGENHFGKFEIEGSLVIGADGIHSSIRSQMHPDQPPIHWGGKIMWRGTTQARPVRTGASFVGLGTSHQRIVFYPISKPDEETGLATINWITEIKVDESDETSHSDWNNRVSPDKFLHHFSDWKYGWLNVPELVKAADQIMEYPMVDRDPAPHWADKRVVLLGDAAHPMYPTGSNGATQAIVDARVLGRQILDKGLTAAALTAYNEKLCDEISQVVLRNRGEGPFQILSIVDERCGNVFEDINDVMTNKERNEIMASYKQAAGFARDTLNESPPIIPVLPEDHEPPVIDEP